MSELDDLQNTKLPAAVKELETTCASIKPIAKYCRDAYAQGNQVCVALGSLLRPRSVVRVLIRVFFVDSGRSVQNDGEIYWRCHNEFGVSLVQRCAATDCVLRATTRRSREAGPASSKHVAANERHERSNRCTGTFVCSNTNGSTQKL